MSNVDRRTFLAPLGVPAVAAALPQDLDKALAIPANNRSGTIDDVEHVVFLMQENRSFDHFFGTLRGVRGFADPHPVILPSGKSVWNQPNGSADLLPFRPEVRDLGQTFLPDPPHGWNDTHAAWNAGRFDSWRVRLPDTDDFKPDDLVRHPDQVPVPPADPELPGQERGVPSRARHPLHLARRRPRRRPVIQHRLPELGRCGRGLPRAIGRRRAGAAQLHRRAGQAGHGCLGLRVRVRPLGPRAQRILPPLQGRPRSRTALKLAPGGAKAPRWSLARTRGWYDLVVTVQDDSGFEYRYAGHLENGEASTSDPGMGGLI